MLAFAQTLSRHSPARTDRKPGSDGLNPPRGDAAARAVRADDPSGAAKGLPAISVTNALLGKAVLPVLVSVYAARL